MPGVEFAAWTYNGRIPGPTLRCREGERLRITFVNALGAPAHDPLPRHPSRRDGRRARPRRGRDRAGRTDRLRVRRAAGRAAPLPLPRPPARRAHRQGPATARSSSTRRRAAQEADEMVMVMNGFDTNFDRANEVYAANTIGFAYMDRADRGARATSWSGSTSSTSSSTTSSTRSTCTGTSSTTSRRARRRRPSELTDTVMLCQGQRGDPRVALPVSRALHVPRPPVRVHRARLAGFFEVA